MMNAPRSPPRMGTLGGRPLTQAPALFPMGRTQTQMPLPMGRTQMQMPLPMGRTQAQMPFPMGGAKYPSVSASTYGGTSSTEEDPFNDEDYDDEF